MPTVPVSEMDLIPRAFCSSGKESREEKRVGIISVSRDSAASSIPSAIRIRISVFRFKRFTPFAEIIVLR